MCVLLDNFAVPGVPELRRNLMSLLSRMDVTNRDFYIVELNQMNPVDETDEHDEDVVMNVPAPADISVPAQTVLQSRPRKVSPMEKKYNHPTYMTMIKGAILELNQSKGASKAAILKYIAQHYEVGENLVKINSHLRLALRKGVEHGEIQQPKGHGASGSFKVSPAHNAAATSSVHVTPPKKEAKAKKAPAKKAAAAKAPAKKRTAAKRAAPRKVKEAAINKKPKAVGRKPRAKVIKRVKIA